MEKIDKIINHPYLTALKRKSMSLPARWLKKHGLLCGRILDFGSGYGFDSKELSKEGFDITPYDNHYQPSEPEGKFDTIICIYVLNVLLPFEQANVQMSVSQWLKPGGKAYFAVRRDLKTEGFRKHAIYKEYTYQCNVVLPYVSIVKNAGFEIYEYRHCNCLPAPVSHCPFCHLSSDIELICETDSAVAFYDAYPVNPGHALIIPKSHVSSYFDLTCREKESMSWMLERVKSILDERFHPDGYNIGINVNEAAGQSVFHVHMHLIPRYKGDVENPKGGVRGVIPERQKY